MNAAAIQVANSDQAAIRKHLGMDTDAPRAVAINHGKNEEILFDGQHERKLVPVGKYNVVVEIDFTNQRGERYTTTRVSRDEQTGAKVRPDGYSSSTSVAWYFRNSATYPTARDEKALLNKLNAEAPAGVGYTKKRSRRGNVFTCSGTIHSVKIHKIHRSR